MKQQYTKSPLTTTAVGSVPIFSIPKCFAATTTTTPSAFQISFPNSALAHSSTGICCLVGSSASFNCPEVWLFAPVAVGDFSRLSAWLLWWIGSISTCVGSAELLFQRNPQPNPGKWRWKDRSESVPKFLIKRTLDFWLKLIRSVGLDVLD